MIYSNLYTLIHNEPEVRQYFETLPSYAREQISTRASNINSFESLKDFAENVTSGDN